MLSLGFSYCEWNHTYKHLCSAKLLSIFFLLACGLFYFRKRQLFPARASYSRVQTGWLGTTQMSSHRGSPLWQPGESSPNTITAGSSRASWSRCFWNQIIGRIWCMMSLSVCVCVWLQVGLGWGGSPDGAVEPQAARPSCQSFPACSLSPELLENCFYLLFLWLQVILLLPLLCPPLLLLWLLRQVPETSEQEVSV